MVVVTITGAAGEKPHIPPVKFSGTEGFLFASYVQLSSFARTIKLFLGLLGLP